MSPSSRYEAVDSALRRAQLYFLTAALDFVVPHVTEVVRLAEAVGLRSDVALALEQLRTLRGDVSNAILAPEGANVRSRPQGEVSGPNV